MKYQRMSLRLIQISSMLLLLTGLNSYSSQHAAIVECNPIRLAILADQTASRLDYGVTPLTLANIQHLIEQTKHCGLDLAVGTVQEHHATPLSRLTLAPLQTEPLRTTYEDPFSYRRDRKEWEKKDEVRNKQIAAFLENISSRLSLSEEAQTSNVWGNLARANAYLREPSRSTKTTKALLIISDLQENTGQAFSQPPDDAIIYLVIGSTNDADQQQLLTTALHFENTEAAINHLAWKLGGKQS